MTGSFRDYISVGINHHLLCKFLAPDDRSHAETLLPLLKDERFDQFDLWIVGSDPWRKEEIAAIKDCGRPIIYNVGDRAGNKKMYPASTDPEDRQYALDMFFSEIDRGLAVDTKKIVTSSGPKKGGTDQQAFDNLVDFYSKLCAHVPDDVTIIIEPTDTDFDKCAFIGDSNESVKLLKAVQECGHSNIGVMIDMCHLPELHETVQMAVERQGEYLKHVHLGTCVYHDKTNPLCGDNHPAWGMPGVELDEKDIADLMRRLMGTGYFSKENRGTASFEMIAYDDIPYLNAADRFFEYMDRAWNMV